MEFFDSRRSPVLSRNGLCCSNEPQASAIGAKILENGGTAADAAVGIAAALAVIQPCMSGLGGDSFALYYDVRAKKVSCLQGNGASPSELTLDLLNERGYGVPVASSGDSTQTSIKSLERESALNVTVPGAAALWDDLVKIHGKLKLAEVLAPAINLAENGFPLSPITVSEWGGSLDAEGTRVLRPNNGRIPKAGELLYNPDIANTMRIISEKGAAEGYYRGAIAEAIVTATRRAGGVLTMEDLAAQTTKFVEPISVSYKGLQIHETPPPSQGLAALVALKLIEKVEFLQQKQEQQQQASPSASWPPTGEAFSFIADKTKRVSVADTHLMVECMRLAMAEALHHVADPLVARPTSAVPVDAAAAPATQATQAAATPATATQAPSTAPAVNSTAAAAAATSASSDGGVTIAHKPSVLDITEQLLSDAYITEKANSILRNGGQAGEVRATDYEAFSKGETAYFCVVDGWGNACSMISSNYLGFGTGIMPIGTGFALHNRGNNFSLQRGHANQVQPNKRPYHTIIPAMITTRGGRNNCDDDDQQLFGVFGCMGGFMQPMLHLQLVRNIRDYGMDPQQALDAPRWYLAGTGATQAEQDMRRSHVQFEEGYAGPSDGGGAVDVLGSAVVSAGAPAAGARDGLPGLIAAMRSRGHSIASTMYDDDDEAAAAAGTSTTTTTTTTSAGAAGAGAGAGAGVVRGRHRVVFGWGHMILKDPATGVLWAGAEPRCDGCATPAVTACIK